MNILKRLLLGFLILAGLFITGCGPDTIRGKEYPINDEKTAADDTDLSIDERVQKIVNSLTCSCDCILRSNKMMFPALY